MAKLEQQPVETELGSPASEMDPDAGSWIEGEADSDTGGYVLMVVIEAAGLAVRVQMSEDVRVALMHSLAR
jgi:hypothetical protein